MSDGAGEQDEGYPDLGYGVRRSFNVKVVVSW